MLLKYHKFLSKLAEENEFEDVICRFFSTEENTVAYWNRVTKSYNFYIDRYLKTSLNPAKFL